MHRIKRNIAVAASQLTLLAVILLAWEYLPQFPVLRDSSHLLDPFFISSPSRIFGRLTDLATGSHGSPPIWNYLWPTLEASLLGAVFGMCLGASVGLVLSSSAFLSDVLHPYIVAANAIPRIALIPIVVILLGPTFGATLLVATMVVFFVSFYNAYEGGKQVAPELINNASLLGGSELAILRHIRLPFVLAWTLAVLPLGITFAVLTVVTTEVLTGTTGMGSLLVAAESQVDASLTFSIVFVLSVMGISIVMAAELFKRRILHWWGK